jgi:hypothetical protein
LLASVADLGLIGHVAPIQLAIRLLIPAGSRLLELDEIRARVGPFDSEALVHPWRHPDPRVDELQRRAEAIVRQAAGRGATRAQVFKNLWLLAERHAGEAERDRVARVADRPHSPIPYLSEPWYC